VNSDECFRVASNVLLSATSRVVDKDALRVYLQHIATFEESSKLYPIALNAIAFELTNLCVVVGSNVRVLLSDLFFFLKKFRCRFDCWQKEFQC
jgi:hypothetical protein